MGEALILLAYAFAFTMLGDIAQHGGILWSSLALLCLTPVVFMLPETPGPGT